MKKCILAMVVVLLFTQSAYAHHFWVEKETDKFKISWGHYPETGPYEPEKVKMVKAYDKQGKEVKLERKDEKDTVYLYAKETVLMVTLSSEGSFLVTTPEGKKRLTKREAQKTGLQIIDAVYSYQFAKSIFGYSNAATKPAGMKFEIVPLKNPYALKPEELLPIKVFFEGRPVEGAVITINNKKETVKSNKDGIAGIKISEKGMQSVSAKKRIPAKDNPDADYLSFTTVLTFDLK
ncbi:MAG: DUF4198 domain-containing protein [Thermodesulfovibrionales bacterium]|nr:DUF4198 domain-containing protein [Thermodesulfovibrionales bacterium]